MLPILGIIAGSGDLPKTISDIYNNIGGNSFLASIDPNIKLENSSCKHFAIGEVGGIIKYFKDNNVENVILVGGINRPNLKSLKVDLSGSLLLAKILKQKILGDDNVLKIIANYITSKGFNVISPLEILNNAEYNIKISSKVAESNDDKTDIEIGKQIIKALGNMDVGQSVIISNGYVIGIEAAEGTDNLISRCAILRKENNGGVLVKMSKSAQDMRLDVPAIGPGTIKLLAENKYSGIAIEKSGVIIINPEEVQKMLDENNLFLSFI